MGDSLAELYPLLVPVIGQLVHETRMNKEVHTQN